MYTNMHTQYTHIHKFAIYCLEDYLKLIQCLTIYNSHFHIYALILIQILETTKCNGFYNLLLNEAPRGRIGTQTQVFRRYSLILRLHF